MNAWLIGHENKLSSTRRIFKMSENFTIRLLFSLLALCWHRAHVDLWPGPGNTHGFHAPFVAPVLCPF
jgi:hypothetical protein